MRKLVLLLVVVGVLVGCGKGRQRYEAGLASMRGHHVDDFLKAWGPPQGSTGLSDGGGIVVWHKSEVRGGGSYSTNEHRTAYVGNNLVSYSVPVSHSSNVKTHECEVRVDFSQDKVARDIQYSGGAFCADWFPVPFVEVP